MKLSHFLLVLAGALPTGVVKGQTLDFRQTEELSLPGIADSNSPGLWRNGRLQIYTSGGTPLVSLAEGLADPFETQPVVLDSDHHLPMWIESVWQDEDGTVFAWYHHERINVCPGSNLTTPMIGALISTDGGLSFRDLGIVIDSGEPVNCYAENGYFANGHGDFSVVLDRARGYFYFFIGAYAGATAEQGVAAARMAFEDRYYPVGAVKKYRDGEWNEPALGGRVTPIFPAAVGWETAEADSFWGPSVHWNTFLNKWVMFLNRSCCQAGWPQEGIYISFSDDLTRPASWTTPLRLIPAGGWYPQVMGSGPEETDSLAGQVVRLFVHGKSDLEIVFDIGTEPADEPENPEAPEDPENPDPGGADGHHPDDQPSKLKPGKNGNGQTGQIRSDTIYR